MVEKITQAETRKPPKTIEQWKTDPRLFQEIATRAIRNLNDGLIELIWNSYDAYRFRAKEKSPIVHIVYQRYFWTFSIDVRDEASGATRDDLAQALTMGAESPERLDDERVRSFFGLGLKQTLLALADMDRNCSVVTIKDGLRHQTQIFRQGVAWEEPTRVGDVNRTLFSVKFYLKKDRVKEVPKNHKSLADILAKDFRLKFILPTADGSHKKYIHPVLTILVHPSVSALEKYLSDGTHKDTV
ncbi:MAG: ATP-binding protein [Candidatus Hodarchaeota archaeon]